MSLTESIRSGQRENYLHATDSLVKNGDVLFQGAETRQVNIFETDALEAY